MENNGKILTILIALVIVLVTAVLLVSYLGVGESSKDEDSRLVVATTIFPLADIAKQVGGERVKVLTITPPGSSPHSYALNPSQLAELSKADVILAIGHGLDDVLAQKVQAVSDAHALVVDRDIDLREFGGVDANGSIDPHYWLSVTNGKKIAQTIADEFSILDIEGLDEYRVNLDKYLEELDELDVELIEKLKDARQKVFVSMHDSWSYFADSYDLTLVDTYEAIEGKAPSLADLRDIQAAINDNSITVFYTEPQKKSYAATRFIENEIGIEIGVLDPLGGVEGVDSFIELMRFNVNKIVNESL